MVQLGSRRWAAEKRRASLPLLCPGLPGDVDLAASFAHEVVCVRESC